MPIYFQKIRTNIFFIKKIKKFFKLFFHLFVKKIKLSSRFLGSIGE